MKRHDIQVVREDGFTRDEQVFCGVCVVCGHMVVCDEFGTSDEPCPGGDDEPTPRVQHG
jgi:hypothetical protein